ncbi:MAG: class I SAM-dependent methyltransferase [Acidimicrobiales bacterium]
MGIYEDHVLPRAIDVLLGNRWMADVRRPAMEGLHGTVLEIGFGSGPNLPLYPPEVDRVLAVDPSAVGRRLATRRLEAATVPVEFVGLDGQHLALEDRCVDAVLSTWTLCTIPDVHLALREAHRVLRDDGRLSFLEHGLSPKAGVASWQHRLTPLQRRIAGGCHLDRDIPAIVRRAGFWTEHLREFDLGGLQVATHMFCGTARKAVPTDPGDEPR